MTGPRSRPPWLTVGWWVRDPDGRFVLGQAPNPPILVWMATVVVGWMLLATFG